MITSCNSPICKRVDGILGFGCKKGGKGNSLFTTLVREEREEWNIKQPHDFIVIPCFLLLRCLVLCFSGS